MTLERLQFVVLRLGFAGVQAVGDEQHDGAPAHEHAVAVGAQLGEGFTQARTSREIVDGVVGHRQHLVGVALAEGGAQVGELCAKCEGGAR